MICLFKAFLHVFNHIALFWKSHLTEFMDNSRLCALESFVLVLREPYAVLEIKLGSSMCKVNTFTPVLFLLLRLLLICSSFKNLLYTKQENKKYLMIMNYWTLMIGLRWLSSELGWGGKSGTRVASRQWWRAFWPFGGGGGAATMHTKTIMFTLL